MPPAAEIRAQGPQSTGTPALLDGFDSSPVALFGFCVPPSRLGLELAVACGAAPLAVDLWLSLAPFGIGKIIPAASFRSYRPSLVWTVPSCGAASIFRPVSKRRLFIPLFKFM